jgi:phosphate transport system ATP-binding protein
VSTRTAMTAPDIRGPARQAAAHSSDEPQPAGDASPCLAAESLDAYFGAARVVRDVSFGVPAGQVTAIIGPSGCGKSTLLRCLNRMHETVPGARVEGEVRFEGRDIYSPQVSAISVRRHIGMVFQRPTPFPTMSIRDNVAAGLKILPGRERPSRRETADIVERSLRHAALWDEVKDRLDASAIDISGGQQQRLCIARALATSPTVLLLDEPTASLDPISTQRVEELVYELRSRVTIIIVTHNMQQAARISDRTAFMLNGELVEYTATNTMFTAPADPRTEAYVTGRFG